LPLGKRSKSVEKLVDFLNGDFWEQLDDAVRSELTSLVDAIAPSVGPQISSEEDSGEPMHDGHQTQAVPVHNPEPPVIS
jgi:hypothetical protein